MKPIFVLKKDFARSPAKPISAICTSLRSFSRAATPCCSPRSKPDVAGLLAHLRRPWHRLALRGAQVELLCAAFTSGCCSTGASITTQRSTSSRPRRGRYCPSRSPSRKLQKCWSGPPWPRRIRRQKPLRCATARFSSCSMRAGCVSRRPLPFRRSDLALDAGPRAGPRQRRQGTHRAARSRPPFRPSSSICAKDGRTSSASARQAERERRSRIHRAKIGARLFLSLRGMPLTRQWIWRLVKMSNRSTSRTVCATVAPRTWWSTALTCAACKSCSATPISPRRRSTRTWRWAV